jgi:hypothetical protein
VQPAAIALSTLTSSTGNVARLKIILDGLMLLKLLSAAF